MNASGYSSVHYVAKPHWLGIPQEIVKFCEGHDFVNDAPVSIYFEELSQAFPGSKFINTTRDLGSWLKSCSQHFVRNLKEGKPYRATLKYRELLYGCNEYNRTKFTKAFHQHKQKVSEFSKKNNVLTLRLEDRGKVGLLKDFLDDDDLSPDYPHVNDLADRTLRRAMMRRSERVTGWV
jgi:hypothetical protein